MKPADLQALVASMTARPWRQGNVETDRIFVHDPNALGGPVIGERVVLRMNTNGEYAATAPTDCRGIVALANHAEALLELYTAVGRRIAARCVTQSATTNDYTRLEYNECAGGTHCSMCPVSKADAAIVAAFEKVEAIR
jgi:hypothetical protein